MSARPGYDSHATGRRVAEPPKRAQAPATYQRGPFVRDRARVLHSAALRRLVSEERTAVFYEAPHRLLDTLEDALESLGNRPAVVAREITKVYEDFLRGHLEDLVAAARKKPPRGEITLLVGPPDGQAQHAATEAAKASSVPLARRVEQIMAERGTGRKAALKQAARERGLTHREAYKQLLITRDE